MGCGLETVNNSNNITFLQPTFLSFNSAFKVAHNPNLLFKIFDYLPMADLVRVSRGSK